ADIYRRHRLCEESLFYTDMLIAWGQDNYELFSGVAEKLKIPICVAGNPRLDLFDRALNPLFADKSDGLRDQIGRYVLLNMNFDKLNFIFPEFNLLSGGPRKMDGMNKFGVLGGGLFGLTMDFAKQLKDSQTRA